jgi:CheY-like chemotaxis protein
MKCLLVDDEPGIREGLASLLRRRGHEIRTALDCADAAAAIAGGSFDAVVTDWRLPDGVASRFVAGCPHPVVVISGRPEEVEHHAAVREVLTKPVSPSRLLQALAGCAPQPLLAAGPLPRDVAAAIAAANACLPAGAEAAVEDDGTFVTWRARLADDAAVPRLSTVGGDFRVLGSGDTLRAELRLHRDGRPDAGMPVVAPDGDWPDTREFAVDFHDTAPAAQQFAAWLERAAAVLRACRRVHFLNIPESLASLASDWERTHRVPMRDPVGPRLPPVLADLWS